MVGRDQYGHITESMVGLSAPCGQWSLGPVCSIKQSPHMGAPLHCVRTTRYFLDQVPPQESPSTPLPNALISTLPHEHVPLYTLGDLLQWGREVVNLPQIGVEGWTRGCWVWLSSIAPLPTVSG